MLATSLFASLVLGLQPNPAGRIVIDGRFDDWASVPIALADPAGAPKAAVDFGEVRISHDDRFVHLLMDFGRTVNVQKLDGTVLLLLDCDGNRETGKSMRGLGGVDVIIELTPANAEFPGQAGEGVGLRSTTYQPDPQDTAARRLSPYDIGFTFAPTYASDRFEFRIRRGVELPQTAATFTRDRFTGKLLFRDRAGHARDETGAFSYELTPVNRSAKPKARDPLSRPGEAGLRIVSWNVNQGALLANSEPFGRVLAAVDPDVILLQELTDRNTAGQVEGVLNRWLPRDGPQQWDVVFGAGGGNLRCVIASRLELTPAKPVELVPHPMWREDHYLRAVGTIIEHAGKRLLVISVHLRARGRAGSREDLIRGLELETLRQAIRTAMLGENINGIIVAGDFNLVGSRRPLDLMTKWLDLENWSLEAAQAYQLDGLSNATWSDPDEPFVPGRLDYLLYSDATLTVLRSFVLDSRDLNPRWLDRHGLKLHDTASASDHLPLIADVKWVDAGL
ncbi:MAG: endonuclease/exonuclease/phosphatase family protein [Planctomycetes bacterium]|nr:endonuclease/exonuclease/phosphatase family protein [Planctomycetota bacterium]